MQTLFISFSGLLVALRDNKVSPHELSNGLFCFGTSITRLFKPARDTEAYTTFNNDERMAQHTQRKIRKALLRARKYGRTAERPQGGNIGYGQLNQLLEANGLNPLPAKEFEHYNYYRVLGLMKTVNPHVRVVWNGWQETRIPMECGCYPEKDGKLIP